MSTATDSYASPTPEQLLSAQPALFDRTHWGRIRLTGADRVRFLHNQTTNNIEKLSDQQGCHTVFVTSTGRTLDLASAYVLPESILLTVSPGMGNSLYDWMDRYIFFSDKVTLTDESEQLFLFTVLGNNADAIIQALGADAIIGQPAFSHMAINMAPREAEASVHIAVGSDLAIAGYTLWGPKDQSAAVWQALCDAGATPQTTNQWEQLRIQQGRPMPTHELTDEDNPLEAGLWHSISFKKGCYIGQETIARLNTYQGVKKRLWGIVPETPVAVGAALTHEGKKVGRVTSIATLKNPSGERPYGLAYLRTKTGGQDFQVDIEGVSARAVSLPFVAHEYYTPDAPNS